MTIPVAAVSGALDDVVVTVTGGPPAAVTLAPAAQVAVTAVSANGQQALWEPQVLGPLRPAAPQVLTPAL